MSWCKMVGVCLLFAAIALNGQQGFAAQQIKVSDVHHQLAQRHLEAGHPFWAVNSYRRALESGADNPNIHRNLSQVLYDLGFVDQAITEMDRAIKNTPEADFLHMEMGVFCLASGRLQRARTHFGRVLELNPGFSYGYYYLGEVLYRLGDYDLASMALVMAHRLGLPGFDLERKLVDIGWQLPVKPWRDDVHDYYLRQITLTNRSIVEEVMQRLSDGELFEELAREFSTDTMAQNGGYIGAIALTSMSSDFAEQLAGVASFAAPILLESGDDYLIVQRIAPFDAVLWQKKIVAEKQQRKEKVTKHAAQPITAEPDYLLLSGVFRNQNYADQRVARLLTLGFKSYLKSRGVGEHLRYEVIAGRFDQYQTAEDAGAQLKEVGLDYYIRKEK